jgi:sugar lactone lactonase YvrE
MSYKNPTPTNIGSTKLSEISMDTPSPLLDSPIHDSALRVTEQLLKVTADLLRRQNFFLRSTGSVNWDALGNIKLGVGINMVVDILQTDHATHRKISLQMIGGTANTTTEFNSISLADNELIYLEIDPANLTSNNIIIENGVGGNSSVFGKTLRKINSTTGGMPQLVSPVNGSTSTTYYIPVAYRSGSSIHWIPHGITWPANTESPLGAVLTDGITPIPEYFVESQLGLKTAIANLNGVGGGVILLVKDPAQPFNIDEKITVGPNITILGRGKKTAITLLNGGSFELQENAELKDFSIITASDWTGNAIHMNGGKRAKVRNVFINVVDSEDRPAVDLMTTYNANSSISNKFANGTVNDILPLLDGSVVVGGSFTDYNGTIGRSFLVKFNANGTLDTVFCQNAVDNKLNGQVTKLALDSTNNILVGGDFTNYNGINASDYLIKISTTGVPNSTFNASVSYKIKPFITTTAAGIQLTPSNIINAISTLSDGTAYVGGRFTHIYPDSFSTVNNTIRKAIRSPVDGSLFIATPNAILKMTKYGTCSVLAGEIGAIDYINATGSSARFGDIWDICIDSTGTNLYVADSGNSVIRKVIISSGVVSTLAGRAPGVTNSPTYQEGIGSSARFNFASGICIDSTNTNLYVADTANHRIRKVPTDGTTTTSLIAGTGSVVYADGAGNVATFKEPYGICIDSANAKLYIADTFNNRIRRILIGATAATSTVSLLAGSTSGYTNGGSTAPIYQFNGPYDVCLSQNESTLYVADKTNNRIRTVTVPASGTGVAGWLAGNGQSSWQDGNLVDNIPGLGTATFSSPDRISRDVSTDNLIISDTNGLRYLILGNSLRTIFTTRIQANSSITTSMAQSFIHVNAGNIGSVLSTTYSFSSEGAFNNSIFSILTKTTSPSSDLFIGGDFTNYRAANNSKLLALKSDGTFSTEQPSLVGAVNNTIRSLKIADNKLLIGGDFTNFGGVSTRSYFTALDLISLTPVNTYDNKFNGSVRTIAADSSNNIYVGGAFTNYGGATGRNRLARISSDTNADNSFMINAVDGNKIASTLSAIAFQAGSGNPVLENALNILLGGAFISYKSTTGLSKFTSIFADGSTFISAANVTGIRVEANNCRIYESWFKGVLTAQQRTAINYVNGYTDNADVDSLFED